MPSMGALYSYSKGSCALLKLLRFEQVLGLWTRPAEELDDREDAVITFELETGKPLVEVPVEFKWGLADLKKAKKLKLE